jgi:ATP-dependent Clp protease ATP-binding subunit ClpB
MTDGHGRTVDFRNTIIIMTSNVGSRFLQEAGLEGLEEASVQQGIAHELKQMFRPEFLNRIDEIITFHSLTQQDIEQIARIQIIKLNDRLKSRNLKISLDDRAMEHLAQKGYDPAFGARPLKRVIQQELENPLSMAILKGEFKPDQTIHFAYDADQKRLKITAA